MSAACPVCGAANASAARFCSTCGTKLEPGAATRETRKTVTVLFADVTGSTALGEQLDPESLRALMSRYFADMKAIIERHGGHVEKFIGDAVMAVFGIPVVHEDDALRAVRAAAEIRDRLAVLNAELTQQRGLAIRFRTGVNTGEVVAGDPATGQTLVTGDTVNTAARLEQAAPPNEILLGRLTYNLVRDAVEVEPVDAIAAKGKAEPVAAYRLVAVRSGTAGHARRLDAPLLGREAELAILQATFSEALAERRCGLVTLLGAAGVGKTRLVAEFLMSAAERATVLAGRCLPYGEGISYWPVAEVVRTAAGIDEADDRDGAMAKLHRLVADAPEAEVVAERIGQAIGLAGGSAPQEEIFWAVRKLLETLARQRPLAIEFDDLQWADDTFLDLLEHIVQLAHDAPLVIVCPARPELLERRPGWSSGLAQATTLRLEPLALESARRLIDQLPGGSALPPALRARILEAADGNPLFVEEMLGMLVDEGHLTLKEGRWQARTDLTAVTVPPTISALLGARLDQLQPGERGLAARASVVGQSFEQAALTELMPGGQPGAIARDLLALVRKELIRPDQALVSAGDAYRFRHLLIRDAAYAALPKSERAELHERFGSWLERVSGSRLDEYEEIVGYHFEQAHAYRRELGVLDAATAQLAERAAERLASAGRRARNTSNSDAAIKILERALVLRPEPSAGRAQILIALGQAIAAAGHLAEARAITDEALAWAARTGHDITKASATVTLIKVLRQLEPADRLRDQWAAVGHAATVLETAGLHGEAAAAYREIAGMHMDAGRNTEALRHLDLAMTQARLSQDHHGLGGIQANRAIQWTSGPLPATAAIEDIESLLPQIESNRGARALVLGCLVELYGLTGRFEEARALAPRARSILLDLGQPLDAAGSSHWSAPMWRLTGNLETAESELRADYETLERAGEQSWRSTTAGLLAHVLCDRSATGEALSLTEEAERIAGEDDYFAQVLWRSARARAIADRDPQAALALARDAVTRAAEAEDPVRHGDALLSLAEVLEAAGRWQEALGATQEAIAVFEAKGATACVQQGEERRQKLLAKQRTGDSEPDSGNSALRKNSR